MLADAVYWTLHDARRTARSLLSRAGVRPDISERVLGHAIGGVSMGVYDRHSYASEKADALKRLADLIQIIVRPQPSAAIASCACGATSFHRDAMPLPGDRAGPTRWCKHLASPDSQTKPKGSDGLRKTYRRICESLSLRKSI